MIRLLSSEGKKQQDVADSSMKTAISVKGAREEACPYSTGHLDEILSIQLHIMRGYYLVSEVLERCTDLV